MDLTIASIVASIMTVLSTYAMKGAEEFVKAAGKDGYQKATNLLSAMKKRWEKDDEAINQLANFEKKPERYRQVLEDILMEKFSHDRDFAVELTQMLKEMEPTLKVIQKMKEAEGVIGLEAKEMGKGYVTVEQEIDKANNIVGAKLDKIG